MWTEVIGYVLTIVLLVITAYFGKKYSAVTVKMNLLSKLIDDWIEAQKDKRITKSEVEKLINDLKELIEDP